MALDENAVMDLLRRFGKAFNRGDVEGILACVTDDFEWRLAAGPEAPHGRVVRGRAEVRAALAERDARYRDVRFSETSVHIAGDRVFGCFRATGSYADGRPLDVRGLDVYELRGDRIAVKDSYWKKIES